MATSGTTTFSLDVRKACEEAYARCSVDKQTLTADHMQEARRSLNLLFSAWDNLSGVPWKSEQATLSLTQSTASYTLPAGVVDVTTATLKRSGVDIDMIAISESDYQSLPNKTDEGRPDRYFLHKLSPPVMYLWQTPENSTDTIEYWRIRQIEDVTLAAQDVDVVQRWYDAMCADLALRLFDKLPDPMQTLQREQRLERRKAESFEVARDGDRDRAPTVIIPGYRNNG